MSMLLKDYYYKIAVKSYSYDIKVRSFSDDRKKLRLCDFVCPWK